MNILIERFNEYVRQKPDALALMMDSGRDAISFAELDDLTGSIYAALKSRNIGREDMVMIFLPRGVQIFVCLLGIVKAGAAFTILEDTAPLERRDRIVKDSGCCLIIDSQIYEEMIACQPLKGFAHPDPHDAGYAVYTSGSSGIPKGVLHEYGQIEVYMKSDPGISLSGNGDEICAFLSPLNFISAVSMFYTSLDCGACALIADYRSVKDPELLYDFLVRNKVTHTIFTPSLLKRLKKIPDRMKQIFVGGEPASGLYMEDREIINIYACSESGFDISIFTIDKPYHLAPVGKSRCGTRILLLDENGNETERGEICFKNPFCRGYIGLEEQNRRAFRNGLYHTGDEGYFTKDGDLVVIGRIDNMIKIYGNRVEPGEVEAAIRQTLHTDTAFVKGFHEDGRDFLVAYIKENARPESIGELKIQLKNILPEYMIPSYYVFQDSFPMLQNGKIDRKSLAAPSMISTVSAEDAPENETEAYLCRLFGKMLSMETVGRSGDFFDLGGDSLYAMKLISECTLPGISVKDLYELRTPSKLAGLVRSRNVSLEELENRRIAAMKRAQPALLETQAVFDVQSYAPESTMCNLSFLFQVKKDISPERLAKAIDKVLRHHPAFSSVFFYEGGRIFQKYRPELYEETEIIHTTEEEFSKIQKGLVRSYETLTNVLLYRKAIYVTRERVLLFFDAHHSITDGTSLKLAMNQICACYQNPETVLPEDYYYLILENFEKQIREYRDENNEAHIHFRNLAENFLGSNGLFEDCRRKIPVKPDGMGTSLVRGFVRITPEFSKTDVRAFLKRNRLTENEFFSAACLLAIARYNGKDKSVLQFIHSGRDDALRVPSCGLLLHSLPLFADLHKSSTLFELFDDIKAQEEYGLAHGNFNIWYLVEESFDLTLFFIFQKDLLHMGNYPLLDRQLELDPPNASDALIVFSIVDNEDCSDYGIEIAYSSTNYKENSIRNLCGLFTGIVNDMLQSKDPLK